MRLCLLAFVGRGCLLALILAIREQVFVIGPFVLNETNIGEPQGERKARTVLGPRERQAGLSVDIFEDFVEWHATLDMLDVEGSRRAGVTEFTASRANVRVTTVHNNVGAHLGILGGFTSARVRV